MTRSGDSRFSMQGGPYSKITFIVRPLHITLHFLHLYTLKIGLKLHICVLKILDLAMPMHMSTFHQDFPQLIFHQGAPLKSPMVTRFILPLQNQFDFLSGVQYNFSCVAWSFCDVRDLHHLYRIMGYFHEV